MCPFIPGPPEAFFVYLILYIPVNNCSVMSGRVFLGWTSTKHLIKCFAQGHNIVTPLAVGLEQATLRSPAKLSTNRSALHLLNPDVLSLNVPIARKVVCFSRLPKCLRSLYGKQCGPRSAVWPGSTLFASILNLSVMLGNYLQQTTSADNIFRYIFVLVL